MILAVTILFLAVSTWIFTRWGMASYVWGFLGYGDEKSKEEAVAKDTNRPTEPAHRPTSPVSEDGDATPKAKPAANGTLPPVPSFALGTSGGDDEDEEEEDNMPPPSFPALNSAQRASGPTRGTMAPPPPPLPSATLAAPSMGPPARPTPPVGLMPPPSGMLPPRGPPASAASGLRVPTTGPLPNRSPGANAGGLAPLSQTALSVPNPRKKVLLKPGHSPLDWATLTRDPKANLAGVPRLMRVPPSLLKSMNGRKGKPAWSSYRGKVYNITPYLPFHPGGEGELRRAAGKDGGKLFHDTHPWVNWENMLEQCVVGILVGEGQGDGQQQEEPASGLDDMD